MRKEPLGAIEELAENERLISRIYRVFSEKFPDHGEFWAKMADEEVQHAGILRSVDPAVRSGTVVLKEGGPDETSLRMFRDYLRFSLARAQGEKIRLQDAFETALAIEHDLIEYDFFGRFEKREGGPVTAFAGLTSSTREHHRRLVEAVEKSGKTL